MKRFIVAIVLVIAVLALGASALADTMFTTKSSVKVYEEPDTHSDYYYKLKGGQEILIETIQDNWYAILVDDGEGQTLGWVQGKYLSESMPEEYCSHDWSSWDVEKEATCTEAGRRTRECDICGKKETQTIKKLGHSFGSWTVTKEATCSKEGERERTCSVCNYVQKEKVEKLEHKYGKWTVLEKATCSEEGERYRKCSVCGYRQNQTLEKLPHTFGRWTVLREATCTEVGQRVHTCEVCGTRVKQSIEKKPHDFEWKIVFQATDYSAGVRARVCKTCGLQEDNEKYDPEGTLRRGDRNEDVRELQELLVQQGYLNVGGADGMFGGGTEKALIKFQQDQGLNPDGVAWPQTLKRLRHDFGPWKTVKEMTRTESGERVRVCRDCGYEQREIIETGSALERGSRGEDVRTLQQIFNQLGYNAGSTDGIYGRKLDSAFGEFAAARGLSPEIGRLRPGDVDAVINAWLDVLPASQWMGESGAGSPVNLALTVTPTGDADDSGVTTFTWTLTNLGSQRCTFTALLLTFGRRPDFTGDDLVMALDGAELSANAGDSVSGSFSVNANWGEGDMNFAALGIHERTGGKWLSNTVSFGSENPEATKAVAPVAVDINVNALADGEYAAAFNRGDLFSGASGVFMNAVHIFTMDTYEKAAIEGLKTGDSLYVGGRTVYVETVKRRGSRVLVNGGMEEADGYEFVATADGNAYRALLYDDLATYTERGVTTLSLDTSAVYIDASNLNVNPLTTRYAGIVNAIKASTNEYFDQYNTTLTIENGKVVEIRRIYVP